MLLLTKSSKEGIFFKCKSLITSISKPNSGFINSLSSSKREVELKYDLEKNVNLIKFSDGKIDIAFNENLSKNFVKNLSEKLLTWTSKRWIITLTKGAGQATFSEMQSINKNELLENERKSNVYKKFKKIFSDGELLEVLNKD